jgi:hypothetical protein
MQKKALSSVFPQFSWESIGKILADLIGKTINKHKN